MKSDLVSLARLIIGLLPASGYKNLALNAVGPGWSINRNARVKPTIFWRIEMLAIGERAQVGIGNVFRDLHQVTVGADAAIGQFNWLSAAAHIYTDQADADYRCLTLAEKAGITSRHYLDCSGGISIGAQSTVAGVRSTIMTHGPDLRAGKMEVAPVTIGEFCFVSANVSITKGCAIGDRIVVGAGSVVTSDLDRSDSLYAGVPARRLSAIDDAAYFGREGLRIDPGSTRPLPA